MCKLPPPHLQLWLHGQFTLSSAKGGLVCIPPPQALSPPPARHQELCHCTSHGAGAQDAAGTSARAGETIAAVPGVQESQSYRHLRWGEDQPFSGHSGELDVITIAAQLAFTWHLLTHHAEFSLMIFLHFSMQKFLESSFFSPCVPKLLCPGVAINFFKQGNKKTLLIRVSCIVK